MALHPRLNMKSPKPTFAAMKNKLLLMGLVGLTLTTALSVPHPLSAQTLNVGNAVFEEPIQIHKTVLRINGTGVRYKTVFRVYSAALYLENKADTPEAVFRQPGAKRLRLVMLRTVQANELGKLFVKGISDNTERGQFSSIAASVFRMGALFAQHRELAEGDTIDIDWVPSTGTVIHVRGQTMTDSFPDPLFYQAMMRIWLGNNPADWKLKDALLGKPSS
jgi:hypothetical protein